MEIDPSPRLPGKPRVFLDISVIFAAIFSAEGGSRALFQLGELGAIELWVGSRVLQEADEVVSGKFPHTRPVLAQFLALGNVRVGPQPDESIFETTRLWVSYPPDAHVLAEALAAKVEFLVTLDRKHFLENQTLRKLATIKIGTAGDCLNWLRSVLRPK